MERDKLGYAISVISHKLWNSNKTNPPNMPRIYWKNIIRQELSGPTIFINNEHNLNGFPIDHPLPCEEIDPQFADFILKFLNRNK